MQPFLRLLIIGLAAVIVLSVLVISWLVAIPFVIAFIVYRLIRGERAVGNMFSVVMPRGRKPFRYTEEKTTVTTIDGEFEQISDTPIQAPEQDSPKH